MLSAKKCIIYIIYLFQNGSHMPCERSRILYQDKQCLWFESLHIFFFFQSLINAFDEQLGANKGQRRLKIYSNRCSLPHGGSRPALICGKGGSPRSLNNHRPLRLLIPILVIKLTFQTSRLFLASRLGVKRGAASLKVRVRCSCKPTSVSALYH